MYLFGWSKQDESSTDGNLARLLLFSAGMLRLGRVGQVQSHFRQCDFVDAFVLGGALPKHTYSISNAAQSRQGAMVCAIPGSTWASLGRLVSSRSCGCLQRATSVLREREQNNTPQSGLSPPTASPGAELYRKIVLERMVMAMSTSVRQV